MTWTNVIWYLAGVLTGIIGMIVWVVFTTEKPEI